MKTLTTSRGARGRRRLRSALALVLALTLAAGSLPAAALEETPDGGAGDVRFYRYGDQLFRLNVEGLGAAGAAALREGGELSIVLSRAVHPSSVAERDWERHGFHFGDENQARTIVDVGTDPAQAFRAAGRDGTPAEWDEVVRWSVRSGATHVTSTFRVGVDWVSVTLHREAVSAGGAELPEGSVLEVEMNGIAVRLDSALLARTQAEGSCGESIAGAEEVTALREMADSFVDLPRFMNHVRGYLEIERQARIQDGLDLPPTDGYPTAASCLLLCTACVASLVSSVGAYLALIAACGSALVTGGTTAIVCISAYLALQASHLVVFAKCGGCADCASEPDCPCAGQPICDCD